MEAVDFCERQKNFLALKEQLCLLQNQQRMEQFNDQLREMSTLKNELLFNLSSIKENIEFTTEAIKNVKPLLGSDSKINMEQSCAEKVKSTIRTRLALENYINVTHLGKNNLNIDIEKSIKNIILHINDYKTVLHDNLMFILNTKKLIHLNVSSENHEENITTSATITNPLFKNHQENDISVFIKTDTDELNIVNNCNESEDSTITFSQAFASSPLHNHLHQSSVQNK